jgi:hypothetical protein
VGSVVKTLAFVIGLLILTVGVIGMVVPSALQWIAGRLESPRAWYALAVIRVLLGVLLLVVAKSSRAPRALRVVAFVPLVAGLAIPLVGVPWARATVEAWSLQGPGVLRLSAIPVLLLGGFIAYACAPARGAA